MREYKAIDLDTSLTCVTLCLGLTIQDRLFYRECHQRLFPSNLRKGKKIINDMTFHLRGFHFIISVDYRKMSVLRRIQCAGGMQSSCGGSGGDRQTRLDHVCWLEVRLSQPGEHSAASGSHPPARCSWCCWKLARVTVGMCPVHSVPPRRHWDDVAGLGPRASGV